ncbi:uncharacterized protein TM35_000331530 [Trypanosoma theileri]|uniref:Uncharacterized protein n=1 Tax=Trypanosoma theileri TaxID=67003 RepID=A0A1X0NLV3_9TRYP|nr:uncharacterized protein TM35_000331530 [Trypanosoma theileri]ORC85696.1 hypothetical protein TM35_000331530 [Trypanosoma theileri]
MFARDLFRNPGATLLETARGKSEGPECPIAAARDSTGRWHPNEGRTTPGKSNSTDAERTGRGKKRHPVGLLAARGAWFWHMPFFFLFFNFFTGFEVKERGTPAQKPRLSCTARSEKGAEK